MGVLTATISGVSYPIKHDSFSCVDRVDQRSTCNFTVLDATGVHFSKGQPVVVTDSVLGNWFSGTVHSVPERNYAGNTLIEHKITCIDEKWKAEKRASASGTYTNWYGGDIVMDQIRSYLAAEGIVNAFAQRRDSSQTDFAAGTLSNTSATSNLGDGDLELSLAGTTVTNIKTTTADFGAGINCAGVNNALQLNSVKAIKLSGTAIQSVDNNYAYRIVWKGTLAIASGDQLQYTIWISSKSAKIVAGVDGQCSDGATIRDNAAQTNVDQNGLKAHPATDLSGFADDQWYTRTISLNINGKTLKNISVVLEGDTDGDYTAYFRNIYILDSTNTVKATIFDDSTSSMNANTKAGLKGYNNVVCKVVTAYEKQGSYPYGIDTSAANIAKSSLITWNASTPDGTSLEIYTSLGGQVVWQQATNGSTIPLLAAGMKMTASALTVEARLKITGSEPTVTPALNDIAVSVFPSYNATKTDVRRVDTSSSDWTTGATLTNTKYSTSVNDDLTLTGLTLNGFWRNWSADYLATILAGQTTYSSGNPGSGIFKGQWYIRTDSGKDIKTRFDFAGQWQNFTAEIDIYVDPAISMNQGLIYRQTNWQSANNSHAYYAFVSNSTISLERGNNSSSGTPPSPTTIASVTSPFSDAGWHNLKIVVNGTSHTVYVDDIQYINATDSTYTAAGYLGVRMFQGTGARASTYFDNFGVVAALSGTQVASSTSIAATGTVYNSVIMWEEKQLPAGSTVTVETSLDGGTNWSACTNGGVIPSLSGGYNASGKSLKTRVTLTSQNANDTPVIAGLAYWIIGSMTATGTRVSPSISLASVGRLGSSLISWNANTPAGTTLAIELSYNGTTWLPISNGGQLPNVFPQPDPVIDGFDTDTSGIWLTSNFVGANATWVFDTANSRLSASGGTNAFYVWDHAQAQNIQDAWVLWDCDQAENAGIIFRYANGSNFYYLLVRDASAVSNPNTLALFKRVAAVNTQISANIPINFTRGDVRRFRMQMVGTTITVTMDGATVLSMSDSSIASGRTGFFTQTGIARFYQIRLQKLGEDVSTITTVYSRATLTSTNPAVTPQLLDLTVSVRDTNIQSGDFVPSYDSQDKYVDQVIDDQAKRSNYWTRIKNSILSFKKRTADPAPFVLQSPDILIDGTDLLRSGDHYRNQQVVLGGKDVVSFSKTINGDSSSRDFSMPYNLAAAPTIVLNGVAQTIGIKGTDTGKNYYWSLDSPIITQDSSGIILISTDALTVSGLAYKDVRVVVDNLTEQAARAAIEGGSGIVTHIYDAREESLNTAAATALANELLTRFGASTARTLRFRTLKDGLGAGMSGSVFFPQHGLLDVTMLIVSCKVTAKPYGTGAKYWYEVVASEGPALGSLGKLIVGLK